MRDIGKNIRQLREKTGLTQEAFAEKLFVTRQTVSNYENGRTRPDLDMLIAIAEVLDADVTHILYGVPTPPDKKRCIRGAIAGGVISVLLLAALAVLTSAAKNLVHMSYAATAQLLLRTILAPAAFLTLGWTLMQLCFVLGAKPPRKCWYKTVKIILLLILAFFALILAPYEIWMIQCAWQGLKYGSVQSFFPSIPIYSHILYWILDITKQYAATFFACLPYGAAIGYFGSFKSEETPNP